MIRIIQFAAIAALALAGCQTTANQGGGSSGSSTGSGISQAAGESACRDALISFHNVPDVRVVSSEPYQGGGRFVRGSVRVSDDGKRELWQCIAYVDGSTGELQYLSDESATQLPSSSAAQMPVAPGSPPFITNMAPDVSQAAIDSCRSALAAQTDGNVSVVGGETSQAATAIYMRVGANGAPWRCLVSADGRNPSTMYMGN